MKQCFLCLFLTACAFNYQLPPYIERAHKLSDYCATKYRTENQLFQNCSGGGFRKSVNLIAPGFISYRKMGVEEGRRLFVEGVELFCSTFNNDPTIRPYLLNYPFEVKNIDLRIAFEDPINFQEMPPPYVSLIYCINDTILYRAYDRETQKYYELHREPYAEALRIVREERANPSCDAPE